MSRFHIQSLKIAGKLLFFMFFLLPCLFSCRGAFSETVAILTPPNDIRNLEFYNVKIDGFTLNWINPSDPDFHGVEIVVTIKGSIDVVFTITLTGLSPGSSIKHDITGLSPDTEFSVRIYSINYSNIRNDGILGTIKTTSSASLQNFYVSGGYTLTPAFSPEITSYTLEVPHNIDFVTLYAELPSNGGAKIIGGTYGINITTPSNIYASLGLNLTSGSATGEVKTRSEDDAYSVTYSLTVTRKGSFKIDTGGETISYIIDPAPAGTLTLSKTGVIKTAVVSIQDPMGVYTAVYWKTDGGSSTLAAKTGTEWILTLEAANYSIKNGHELSIMVVCDGIPYSGNILFNVTEN